MTKLLTNNLYRYVIISVILFIILIGLIFAFYDKNENTVNYGKYSENKSLNGALMDDVQNISIPSKEILSNTSSDTVNRLNYLIEEEKLAHDVYLKMYEKYGARVFGNILKSENSHQSRVLTLLNSRDIADPRTGTLGVFNNQDLQILYNKLIAQGDQSLDEAYEVGIYIEELDIADIKNDLTATDQSQTDIISTLEALLRGSENHLRAFTRQVR